MKPLPLPTPEHLRSAARMKSGSPHRCRSFLRLFAREPLHFCASCGNIIRQYCIVAEYALVAQPVEHLTFNQRARDSSSLERTKIPRRIVRFLVGFSFCSQAARFCTVRIFRVRWSKSVNYSAIRAIFCNSGQQSQAKLCFYGRVCVLQKLQKCRHGDGRFCFNRGSLHKCCSLYGFHITAGDHQLVSRAQAARWNR